jgi:ABC transport system ATP-binding/permease protein
MAAAAMGLTISAAVTTADKAIGTVPIVLIPQVILSGAIVTLNGFSETLARWSMISYWSFDCMKATLASEVRQVVGVRSGYWTGHAVVILFFLGFLLAAAGALKLRDRRR